MCLDYLLVDAAELRKALIGLPWFFSRRRSPFLRIAAVRVIRVLPENGLLCYSLVLMTRVCLSLSDLLDSGVESAGT